MILQRKLHYYTGVCIFYIVGITIWSLMNCLEYKRSCKRFCKRKWKDDPFGYGDFDNFDNEVGTPDGKYIVPNYVHFVRFHYMNYGEVSFMHAICILAAFKNQKPDKIFIHYDSLWKPWGKYWDALMKIDGLRDIMVLNRIKMPFEIFGQEILEFGKFHSGDIARLMVLMKYGGIFLDNDAYIVRSLNDYRKYEITVSWLKNWMLMNQAIISNRNARFLKIWLNSYRNYNSSRWYWNAGKVPTNILTKLSHLVHREQWLLVSDQIIPKLYTENWEDWKSHYVLHLNIRWTDQILRNPNENATYPVEFNEQNIDLYNVTIRDIVYAVYPFDL